MRSPASNYLSHKLSLSPRSPSIAFTAHCGTSCSARPSARLRSADVQICHKARFNVFGGQHRLHLMGMAGSPTCPLCGHARDTGFHTLLSCRFPAPLPASICASAAASAHAINLMATLRHNAAVHLLADAIRKLSKDGGSSLLVNAGKSPPGDVQRLFVDACLPDRDTITVRGRSQGQDNTVPAYLLPDYPGRPDLMIIQGWCGLNPAAPPTPVLPDGSRVTLAPVEVCYAQDDCIEFMRSAMERKWRKYQGLPELHSPHTHPFPSSLLNRDLLGELRARGWRVLGQHADGTIDDVGPFIVTLPIGATGQQLACTRSALLALGLSASAADHTLHALVRLSVRESAKILRTKLRLHKCLAAPAVGAAASPSGSLSPAPPPACAPAPSRRCCRLRAPAERAFQRARSLAAHPGTRSLVPASVRAPSRRPASPAAARQRPAPLQPPLVLPSSVSSVVSRLPSSASGRSPD